MVKHKVIKIRLSTWKKLREIYPGKSDETFGQYVGRIAEKLKWANAMEFDNE